MSFTTEITHMSYAIDAQIFRIKVVLFCWHVGKYPNHIVDVFTIGDLIIAKAEP